MANLLLPNIAQTAMQGYQQGQGMAANKLLGLAMSSQDPSHAQQYYGQAAQINPGAVLDVQNAQARNQYMQSLQQQAQQRAQQSQQEMVAKKAGAAARYWKAAVSSGDPAAKAAAFQNVQPFLAQQAAAQGKPPPTAQDLESPQAMAGLDQIIAQTAYLFPDDAKLQVVAPGSTLLQGTNPVYTNPQKGQIVNGYYFNPNNGTAAPIPIQSNNAPQQDAGVNATIPGASGHNVTFDFPPGTPPEVIAATKASAVANGDISQDQAAQVGAGTSGGPQSEPHTLAQAQISQKVQEAQAAAQAKGAAAGASGGADGLTPDAESMLAQAGMQGYKIPIPAMGMKSTAGRIAYLNSLADNIKQSGVDWPTAVHNMVFGETGLTGAKGAQRIYGQTMANERAVEEQIPTIMDLSSKVGRSGAPVLNRWILSGRQNIAGDPDVTAFSNAVNEFAEEYAKVMSGSPTGAATDSARGLAHTLINSAMNPQQFQQVMQTMQTMMKQRVEGQRAGINEQISGLQNSGAGQQAAPQSSAPAPGTIEQGYRFKGGDPSNQANWEPVQ